jgi:hypothetical protein
MEKIRREVYLSYTQDGLIDLSIGLVIFGFGALLLVDAAWMVGALGMLPLIILYLGKRIFTVPRIGSLKPAMSVKRKLTGFLAFLIATGLGVLALFVFADRSGGNLLSGHSLALFGLVLAFGISALGLVLKNNRLYVYAFLVFVAMAAGEWLQGTITIFDTFLVAVIGAGAVILVSGIIVLVRFMQIYPVVKLEE